MTRIKESYMGSLYNFCEHDTSLCFTTAGFPYNVSLLSMVLVLVTFILITPFYSFHVRDTYQ